MADKKYPGVKQGKPLTAKLGKPVPAQPAPKKKAK
jgi:hypothetical protein